MNSVNDYYMLFAVVASFSYVVFLTKRFFSWMDAVDNGEISQKNRESNLFFLMWAFFLVKGH